jgi:hypothetical protein
MKAVVNGGGGNGVFAAAIHTNNGMVAAASTATAQLMRMTAIATTTIGQRHHCHLCHCIIFPPSHCRLGQGQPQLTKTTIATAAIDHCFCQK